MSEIAKQIVGSIVRSGLIAAFSWLVTHGYLTPEYAGSMDVESIAVGIAGVVVVLAWSIYQKMRGQVAMKVALNATPKSSEDHVLKIAKALPASCAFRNAHNLPTPKS